MSRPIKIKEFTDIFNIKESHLVLSKLYSQGYILTDGVNGFCWYKNGLMHRDNDKPAVIFPNNTKAWYKNGKIHRDGDKPAVMGVNGTKMWYKNGLLHRGGGKPAIILPSGTKEWWKNGQFIKDNF